ncbi:related to AP1-like transcription factor [Cephalotrichum gorgonifer]|uniref:Related to AP1-like transcription factor n=1 Tax=Cephalotrichum gorgonifer TaxID=2041049 RepID=A0AAE8SXK7_9PEZI|nr:related to AP1-like transcription factor [Cephalotrichum gorgonifer]
MASTGYNTQNGFPFYLSPQQQQVLLQALASGQNKQPSGQFTSGNSLSMSPTSLEASPAQQTATYNDLHGSPYLGNYDVDFGADSSFDFDVSTLSNPIPDDGTVSAESGSPENDTPEKRARDDDDDNEGSPGGNDAKRRESTDKVPKKPGRKPLTSEPTSKRKAQNRAAQRAFRERKEQHLKDLETKVVELEKKSDAANSQNTTLRKQLETVTAELNEYKRKVRLMASGPAATRDRSAGGIGNQGLRSLNNIDFQFEFPKFGHLPGPVQNNARPTGQKSSSSSPANPPLNTVSSSDRTGPKSNGSPASANNVNRSPASHYDLFNSLPITRSSLDSGHYSLGSATTGSPSGSSPNLGTNSSCGTSPEPYTQSPLGFKPVDTMTTIGEEQPSMSTADNGQANTFGGNLSTDLSFDWLAQQNGGQFDPQLYGDYREPQNNILSLEDTFFNDAAIDMDFFTPYNLPPTVPAAPAPKKDLVAQINAQLDTVDPIVVKDEPAANTKDGLNCVDIWNKIQTCEKVQGGDFDLDSLCSELQAKAKCSGEGPVVQEQEFEAVLGKYLGNDFVQKCGDKLMGREGEQKQKA